MPPFTCVCICACICASILIHKHQLCKSVLTADADFEAAYMMCKAVAILTTMSPGEAKCVR